jgi:AraC family transcriptional regulator, regulatory protein of adaptative response / methylated-DNA-[protein]-cysteine methyltransferase
MPEQIRYAWGSSSLGEFLAAQSDQGIVAFEFVDGRDAMLERLHTRLPSAVFVKDEDALRDTLDALSGLVDHPQRDPAFKLDMRGTDDEKRVWEILRRTPAGATTNYGAIAAELGTRDARDVTKAVVNNSIAILVPCHRVVKKDGSISGFRWGVKRKRTLLSREQQGVGFRLE